MKPKEPETVTVEIVTDEHEAFVAAAVLGIAQREGWITSPLVVDLAQTLPALAGSVRPDSLRAAKLTIALIRQTGGSIPVAGEALQHFATALAAAYDLLIEEVEPRP